MANPTVDLVARALAHADAPEQAAFLNAFVHELKQACREGKYQRAHYQWSWIADALDGEARIALGEELPQAIVSAKDAEAERQQAWAVSRDEIERLRQEIATLERRRAELEEAIRGY